MSILFAATAFLLSTDAMAGDELAHELVRHSEIADGRPKGMDKGFIRSYETAAGYTISVGDTMILNLPTGASSRTRMAGGGSGTNNFALGAAAATTVSNQYFKYVYNGTYAATVAKAILLSSDGDPSLFLAPSSLTGAEIEITRMKLGGTRRRPLVWVETNLVSSRDKKNLSGIVTISDFDLAARTGEVYHPNNITREIAIQRLREAKELVDIGLMTPAEFEEQKKTYAPYVK